MDNSMIYPPVNTSFSAAEAYNATCEQRLSVISSNRVSRAIGSVRNDHFRVHGGQSNGGRRNSSPRDGRRRNAQGPTSQRPRRFFNFQGYNWPIEDNEDIYDRMNVVVFGQASPLLHLLPRAPVFQVNVHRAMALETNALLPMGRFEVLMSALCISHHPPLHHISHYDELLTPLFFRLPPTLSHSFTSPPPPKGPTAPSGCF